MSANDEELGSEELVDFVLGSLDVSGAAFEDRVGAALRALGWLRHLQGFGYDAIPFVAVHDVGHLLLLGDAFPFRAVTDLERWGEEERPLRLAYENRFLNALRSHPRVRRLIALLAQQAAADPAAEGRNASDGGARPERQDRLVCRSMEILFAGARELRLAGAPRLNPVHLRDLAGLDSIAPRQARARFEEARPGFFLHQLAEFLERQAGTIDVPRLLREEDFFELAHFDALDRPHRRLFARRVQELITAAGPIDVARTRVKVESEEASTAVADEGSYPTGGIGEITTKGSLENLVRSELVYRMHDGPIDLFALRWAEGDLLFYTRDAGSLHRKRRSLIFALDPSRMRVKDPRHPTSLAVLAYSLVGRTADDLLELFGGEGARVEIRVITARPMDADLEEAELLEMRLRDAVRRGDAHIALERALEPVAAVDPRRKTFVVAIGDVPADGAQIRRSGGHFLRVHLGPRPGDHDPDGDELYLDPADPVPGDRIGEVRDALLTRVVGIR